ncbi:MAG: hypothetical protein IPM47_21145 [Sphingobacteriales bacterium]|nr:MAG: hypothetical protein IPM47_21145 [Sphingobacteriales bacterium]
MKRRINLKVRKVDIKPAKPGLIYLIQPECPETERLSPLFVTFSIPFIHSVYHHST